jgi:hypothetical protein
MLERPLIAGSALVGMSSLFLSWWIGSVVNYAAVQRALGGSIAGREMPRSVRRGPSDGSACWKIRHSAQPRTGNA